MKCFLCDGQHLARECHKRNVLCAPIKEREKEEEEARPSLNIQMIGALQVMLKFSSLGSEAKE